MSKQRKLVLQILRNSEGHLTAHEIYEEARKTMPNISLGTVYRNLAALTGCGEIATVEIPGGASYFDKTATEHDHLICTCCGRIKDLDREPVTEVLQDVLGVELDRYSLTAYYVCDECREKENRAS